MQLESRMLAVPRQAASGGTALAEQPAEASPDVGSPSWLKAAGLAMSFLKPIFAAEAQLQAFGYDRAATRAALEEEAGSAPVVIYTYSLSPFSKEATRLLDSLGATYKEVVPHAW